MVLLDGDRKNRRMDTMCWDQIFLIFFDKLLIGLILLAVGYWTKRQLDKSKATFGLSLKFSEEKIRRIGAIWTDIDECEVLLRSFQSKLKTAENIDGSDRTRLNKVAEQAVSLGKRAADKYTAMRMNIERNRFWLGDDSVYQCTSRSFAMPIY